MAEPRGSAGWVSAAGAVPPVFPRGPPAGGRGSRGNPRPPGSDPAIVTVPLAPVVVAGRGASGLLLLLALSATMAGTPLIGPMSTQPLSARKGLPSCVAGSDPCGGRSHGAFDRQ